VQVQVVVGTDGAPIADSAAALAFVSRHGLSVAGVSCPGCGELAAKPNQWRKVRHTKWGEAIQCRCGKVLLASPDDDLDPVKPGQKYDETLYHQFHRPPNWRSPIPRLRAKVPVLGDWVYVVTGSYPTFVGESRERLPQQNLAGAEGRVNAFVSDDEVEIALGGTSAMGGVGGLGGAYAILPVANAFCTIPEAIRLGDLVTFTKGDHDGRTGTVKESLGRARFIIALPPSLDGPARDVQTIIEHISLTVLDEIDVDSLAPDQLPTRKYHV